MTFSVDDLVASFSSSHIGQEAIDLANLQAQLAQSLAYSQQQQSTSGQGLCNTPTARTPTMSFANWGMLEQRRARSSSSASVTSRRGALPSHESDMILEEGMDADDEYAVEQLVGSPHASYREAYAHPAQIQSAARYPHDYVSECASPTSSNYASSDPFYAAAAAAAAEASNRQAHQAPQNSVFAQIGRPTQHSPFYTAHAMQTSTAAPFESYAHSMDTRARFFAAGTVDA
ncbi:hypothetical protein EW145_g1 [Phellinidium pouzarii]|uniref:Uncharacterized protein n=1 Tax=Phellinidium pouzarii TaxID=167371 RepID=A0A4S4LJZ9_9AGAM|nr:hypothetical protein EW145_g1 [Phellinidium pouzarii]